jgi:hypothetical protein
MRLECVVTRGPLDFIFRGRDPDTEERRRL